MESRNRSSGKALGAKTLRALDPLADSAEMGASAKADWGLATPWSLNERGAGGV